MLHFKEFRHASSDEWVCFVHGAGGSSNIWFKQIKDFTRHFNVILVDLRGHGDSKSILTKKKLLQYSFEKLADDVLEVLDFLKLQQVHCIGISLGTIIIRQMAEMRPDIVRTQILGGAVLKLNFKSQFLLRMGIVFKSILPYMWLYRMFAFAIMPKANHKEARILFAQEAKKLYQKEFVRWFKLAATLNPLLHLQRSNDIGIPTLYIMGDQDYMFLPSVEATVKNHNSASLSILQNSGHVVNVEQPEAFNKTVIAYINQYAKIA